MDASSRDNKRKYPRFGTVIPMRFNLNPDYHFVPKIKGIGVGGTVKNISCEGLLIYSRMDLLDVCQIFSESFESDSRFELEVFVTDPMERTELIRGAVRWYRVSFREGNIRKLQAGLYLKDMQSRAVARRIIDLINTMPIR